VETVFVSRAGADTVVSETVARILTAAGYHVILQQRDFSNASFIAQMHSALENGARVVALLSPAYLASDYCAAEWQSVLAGDPLNRQGRLIVMRVTECTPPGLLAALAYWDLVGVADSATFESTVIQAARVNRRASPQAPAAATLPAPAALRETELPRSAPGNLPPQMTTFIGRSQLIAEIASAIGGARLSTLVGAGGIGKTRTALQVAGELQPDFHDGAWFVDLAPLRGGDYVVPEIASVLGVREESGKPLLDVVVAALTVQQTLIVLDNCEHVIEETRAAAAAMIRSCAGVRILATSRELLGVAGEFVVRLPPLGVPAAGPALTSHEAGNYEAVGLFVARANAVDGRFAMTDLNAATIADICRRLDGLPLAIELAAARIRVLNLNALSAKLGERFRLLTGGSKTALPRQQTMRALIDWSYDLLEADEQRFFRRLSIFAGGWTLEAAATVCGDPDDDEFTVLDRLTSLADKSLVVVDFAGEAQRFRFLESIRAYALERSREHDDVAALARRRASFFAAYAGDGSTVTADVRARIHEIEEELENLREVLHWALDERHDVQLGAQLAYALGRFWAMQQPREGQRWLKLAQAELGNGADAILSANVAQAIAAMLPHGSHERFEATLRALEASRPTGDPRILTKALAAYGEQLTPLGQLEEAEAAYVESLGDARTIASDWDAGRALAGLAIVAVDRGDIASARDLSGQAMATFEALGASDGVAYVCITLGEAEFRTGHIERAAALVQQARQAYGTLGNHRSSACAADYLAAFAIAAGDVDAARTHARDALQLLTADRHPMFLSEAIEHLGHVASLHGDVRRGALLYGYADAAFAKIAHKRSYTADWCRVRYAELLRGGLDAEHLAALTADGAALSEDRAIEEAFAV
jgi:predicted ATPase